MVRSTEFSLYESFSLVQKWLFHILFIQNDIAGFPLPIAIAATKKTSMDSLRTILAIPRLRYAHAAIRKESEDDNHEVLAHDRSLSWYAFIANAPLIIFLTPFLFSALAMVNSASEFFISYTVTATALTPLREESLLSDLDEPLEPLIGETFTGEAVLISAIETHINGKIPTSVAERVIEGCHKNLLNARFTVIFWTYFLMSYVLALALSRMAVYYINRRFAPSLCVYAAYGIILDLSDDSALSSPSKKRRLQKRISQLARFTLLLRSRYASRDRLVDGWSNDHFQNISRIITERERWVIAPIAGTLGDLRIDFSKLIEIYLHGLYGEHASLLPEPPAEQEEVPQSLWWEKVRRIPPLLGMLVPLILMGTYLWRPESFPLLDLDAETVALIFISWLLLSIDAVLDLGIVRNLVDLAKGIRGLK